MGMDLISKSGTTLDMSSDWWLFYRTLAEKCGWNPKGAGKPDHLSEKDEWDGNYDYNDGQIVYEDDARALAQALERAITDQAAGSIIEGMLDAWWEDMLKAEAELSGLSKQQKKLLRAAMARPKFSIESAAELIDLCKQGEFRIE
jgi:hypothetical protein